MSEAYLFASSEAPAPDSALQELLLKAGARPAWLDEVHWLGQPSPAPPADLPFYAWPDHTLLPFFCLQSALIRLETGAADLLALGQSAAEGSAALLLGSPAVVGRWNLPPAARLRALPTPAASPAAFVEIASRQAAACLPEEAQLALACLRGISETELQGLPAGLARLPSAPLALSAVAQLAGELTRTKQDFALLAEFSTHAGLAFLLERV